MGNGTSKTGVKFLYLHLGVLDPPPQDAGADAFALSKSPNSQRVYDSATSPVVSRMLQEYKTILEGLQTFLNIDDYKEWPDLTPEQADLKWYPSLWANTSRVFAAKVYQDPKEGPSAYAAIKKFLQNLLKKYPWYDFSLTNRAGRKAIKEALEKLEKKRKQDKREFLYNLKTNTAQFLRIKLAANIKDDDPPDKTEAWEKIKKKLEIIQKLCTRYDTSYPDSINVGTRNDVLSYHNFVGELKSDLWQFSLNYINACAKATEVRNLALQLEISTQRFLDPIYKEPNKQTNDEDIRDLAKMLSFFIAILFLLLAVACLFVPPLAPLAVPLGMVGFIGLWPLVDTLITTICNLIRYKRAPITTQMIEIGMLFAFGIAYPFVHFLPVIGSVLAHVSKTTFVTTIVAKAGNIITKAVNYAGMFLTGSFLGKFNVGNFFRTLRNGLRSGYWVRPEKLADLKNHKEDIPTKPTAKRLLAEWVRSLRVKNLQKFKSAFNPKDPVPVNDDKAPGFYYLKMQNSNIKEEPSKEIKLDKEEETMVFGFQKSVTPKIQNWTTFSIFASGPAKELIREVNGYKKLGSTTSLEVRQKHLNQVAEAIEEWEDFHETKTSHRSPRVAELKRFVKDEQKAINTIEKETKDFPVEPRHRPLVLCG